MKKNIRHKNYPFGMLMQGRNANANIYRFEYQGSEKDDEIYNSTGTSYTAESWQYDSRLGRRWNLDPKPNPSISSYATFANNPICFSDVLGDTVSGDEKGMKAYNNYRKEVNERINAINKQIKELGASSELNNQLQAYNKINSELNALEADPDNLYFINSDVTFEEKETKGKTYFKGMTIYNGNKMKQINIDLAKTGFPMNRTAHEFKHAYQYYEGLLIFVAGTKSGFNSQELEHEAFERGNRFSGSLFTNGQHPRFNYKYKPVFHIDSYKELSISVTRMTESNHKMKSNYWKKKGTTLIYNLPK